MAETAMECCSQCPNHCPADDLKCGRGESYFARMQGIEQERQTEYSHGGAHEQEHGHGGAYEKGREHKHGGAHGHEHGRGAGMGKEHFPDKNSLYGLLRGCGHYLHHNCGRDMGAEEIQALFGVLGESEQAELKVLLGKLLAGWESRA